MLTPKYRMVPLLAAVLLVLACMAPALSAQDSAAARRTFTAPDLGSFEYPLDLYSVRSGALAGDFAVNLLFPGVVSVEPNDSFVYQDGQGIVYKLTIASFVDEMITADTDPAALLGKSPLLVYDAAALAGLDVQAVTVGGLRAARVNDLPGGVVNQAGVAAHIIAVAAGRIIEIAVEPVVLLGAPNHNDPMSGDPDVNRGLYEDILASLVFIP